MATDNSNIDHFYSLQPLDYPFVEELSIRHVSRPEDEYYDLVLELMLRPQSPQPTDRTLHLTFLGVRDLHLNPSTREFSLTQLDIRSIKDSQWEGLRYRVIESEDEMLSFFCKSFSAELISD